MKQTVIKSNREHVHDVREVLKKELVKHEIIDQTLFKRLKTVAETYFSTNKKRVKVFCNKDNNSVASLNKGKITVEVLFVQSEENYKIMLDVPID